MARSNWSYVPAAIALGIGLVLGSWANVDAQDRGSKSKDPAPPWAKELIVELRQANRTRPDRFRLVTHEDKLTTVFDSGTGQLFELQDGKKLKRTNLPGGQLTTRFVAQSHGTVGGTIRPGK
jgi:hypothetical protein